MSARERVVVTGVGVHTPVGRGPKELWHALCEAEGTAAAPIRAFDAAGLPGGFAAEVPGFRAEDYMSTKEAARTDRVTHLGLAAAVDAWADADGGPDGLGAATPERIGVVCGTGYGGAASYEAAFTTTDEQGWGRPGPLHIPSVMANAAAAAITQHLPARGPSLCLVTACASGAHALGEGARLIREGACAAVIAGGAEAPVTPVTVMAFQRLGATSARSEDPARASRPFDAGRDGFVLAEGAGFVVLESLSSARRRDARVYAELAGYGRTSDGHHLTAPAPGGAGARRAMELALADAGKAPEEIRHVNAHATSTPRGDIAEAQAITALLGTQVPVTASKGVTGHLLGASGAVEAVATLLTMRDRLMPPVANLDDQDPNCPVNAVRGQPREIGGGPALTNSFGFGGHNASLVFTPLEAG